MGIGKLMQETGVRNWKTHVANERVRWGLGRSWSKTEIREGHGKSDEHRHMYA